MMVNKWELYLGTQHKIRQGLIWKVRGIVALKQNTLQIIMIPLIERNIIIQMITPTHIQMSIPPLKTQIGITQE